MGEAEQNISQNYGSSTQVHPEKSARLRLTDFLDALENKLAGKLKKEVSDFESELGKLKLPQVDTFDLEAMANGLRSFGKLLRRCKRTGDYESLRVMYDILQNMYLNAAPNDDTSVTMYSLLKKYAKDVA